MLLERRTWLQAAVGKAPSLPSFGKASLEDGAASPRASHTFLGYTRSS